MPKYPPPKKTTRSKRKVAHKHCRWAGSHLKGAHSAEAGRMLGSEKCKSGHSDTV